MRRSRSCSLTTVRLRIPWRGCGVGLLSPWQTAKQRAAQSWRDSSQAFSMVLERLPGDPASGSNSPPPKGVVDLWTSSEGAGPDAYLPSSLWIKSWSFNVFRAS